MFYFILLTGIFLSLFNEKKIATKFKEKKIATKIYISILIILAIFRYGLGADYFSYKYLYQILKPNVIEEFKYGVGSQEIGFRLIGAFFKQIGIPYQIYLALFAIVSLIYMYKISIKYSKNSTLSVTIFYSFYYLVWVFSRIRQGTVICIGLYYLLESIEENSFKKIIITSILLSFIHKSALLLLLFYLLANIDLNRNKLLIIIGISVIIGIFPWGNILNRLSNVIPLVNRVKPYINTIGTLSSILDFQTIGRLPFITIAIFFYNRYIKEYPSQKILINIYILSFAIYFGLKFSVLTAARLSVYGRILDSILLVNILYMLPNRKEKQFFRIILIVLMILYSFKEQRTLKEQTGMVDDNHIVTPYVNIFNQDKFRFNNRYLHLQ